MPRHLEDAAARVEGIYTFHARKTSTGREIRAAVVHNQLDIATGYLGATVVTKHNTMSRIGDVNDSAEVRGRSLVNNKVVLLADAGEIEDIAHDMELPEDQITERYQTTLSRFMAEVMAVNVVIRADCNEWNLRDYAQPSLKIFFAAPEEDSVKSGVWVHEYSRPCSTPVREMATRFEELGIVFDYEMLKRGFKRAAREKRGWLAMPYLKGGLAIGDELLLERPLLPEGQAGS